MTVDHGFVDEDLVSSQDLLFIEQHLFIKRVSKATQNHNKKSEVQNLLEVRGGFYHIILYHIDGVMQSVIIIYGMNMRMTSKICRYIKVSCRSTEYNNNDTQLDLVTSK